MNRPASPQAADAMRAHDFERTSHGTLHGLFEAQCRLTPAAVAAIYGDQRLTYAELNRRADAVAQHLVELGVRPGSLVGLFVERGLDLVVGVLGVLKSGGAYVPLDPAYPLDRLAFMLEDAEVQVLLTQQRLCSQLPHVNASLALIDGMSSACAGPRQANKPADATAHDLAYVIYTSGSTGQPKGVMIEHGAAINTIADINQRFGVTDQDRVLALSSYGFDLSVYDMFGLWSAGGAIVLPEAIHARSPAHWADLCQRHRVTIWNSVPASMEMMVTHLEGTTSAALEGVRLALLSGDWIPVTLPDRIRALNPATCVVSLGGATEVSIWSIIYPIDAVDPSWTSIPYGVAMNNHSVHLLDEQLREVRPGDTGQIYYGGLGLARGYHRRPQLTDERFITWKQASGEWMRLYASGDLGRLRSDGLVELLGRMDTQVKVRGYRIELGEIEAVVCRHPGVRQAVLLADRAPSGQNQLVAFVVPISHDALDGAEVREHVRRSLPEYMTPARVLFVDQLPLTDNQKIDRQALPALYEQFRRGAQVSEPTTEVERRLLAMWQELLGAAPLGIDDDFFECGGDSMQAAKLMLRVEAEFGLPVPLGSLLEHSTIRSFARLLESPPTTEPLKPKNGHSAELTRAVRDRNIDQQSGVRRARIRASREPMPRKAWAQLTQGLRRLVSGKSRNRQDLN